ncbi:AdoMet-homocysteine methyltransferase [Neocucurbitaria cava]|uniref:AdoMet-homocysteine methyltransferase n=1 Tax=Neocucurbitaria cava TaxID=798079 RepID=A0A9W9CJK0_9PLEO|nr:AdoMet-homocysteine methyltransferase [Neocucurbitaria cava]
MSNLSSKINRISTEITNGNPIILDGALATYLESLGADISGALWSADILIKNPSLIKQTHLDYYRAGATVAITASYQASIAGLTKHLDLSEKQARDVIQKSVQLARQARDEYVAETLAALSQKEKDKIVTNGGSIAHHEQSIRSRLFIAGSVGPYGAFLADGSEYRGDYSLPSDDMKAFHRGRIQALVGAGVDLLACETIPSKSEAEALLQLLRTEFPDVEAWFSFTLRDSSHISDGTPLTEIATLFTGGRKQVVALGFNCVPDDVALDALRNLATLIEGMPLVVYPNSGEQWNAKAREWEGNRTEGSLLAEKTVEWWNAGARLIGGCCRTTPDDIRVMNKALHELLRK